MSRPQQAGDLVRSLLRDVGSKASRRRFADALERAVGERIAPHVEVIGFRRGKLVVQVDSAPLCAELNGFRREEIRARCNEQLDKEQIAEIVFRMEGTAHA